MALRTAVSVFMSTILLWVNAQADEVGKKRDKSPKEPIRITSDELFIDNAKQEAEFVGRVEAVQDNTTIHSSSLKIFYKKDSVKNENVISGEQSIDKIIAKGDVRINFDNRLAEAEVAVYNAITRVLVLTGENSKITSGANSITGEKITLYRDNGRVFVEGSQDKAKEGRNHKKRVEAVLSTIGKGID